MMKTPLKQIATISSFLFLLLLSACGPMSKEDYFERYDSFMDKVAENKDTYSETDWLDCDKEVETFQGKWYDKFEKEFTFTDHLEITKHAATYKMYRTTKSISNFVEDLHLDELRRFIYKETDSLRSQLEYYYKNDMDSDIEQLQEEAEKMGEEAQKIVNDMIEDIKKNL